MKRAFLLFILLSVCGKIAGAATISGIVTSGTTCSPVVTQVVIEDNFQSWHDTVVSNSNGDYSFVIPNGVSRQGSLTVTAFGCGLSYSRKVEYNGNNIRQNIPICGPGKGIGIVVNANGNYMDDLFVVYLIRRDVDPVTADTTLTAVDSSYNYVGMTGISYIEYACVPTGTYLAKAALRKGNVDYARYLPSYYTSSLNWSGADTLTFNQLNFKAAANIALVPGSNPGGPGFIGGSVLAGANKSTAVGDPLSGRLLMLQDATTGNAIAYTYSDVYGNFRFLNLAYGTYKLFGDAGGKKNPALLVTLSASEEEVSNIVFEENNKKFEGHFSVGVRPLNTLSGLSVFPNPVTDFAGLKGLSAIPGTKTVVLSSVTGAEISRQTVTDDVRISTAALPAGVYLLQVKAEAGVASFRIVK